MDKRTVKDLLYEQVARIGKAVSSPKRLELLELLAQEEKSVEMLANALAIEIKLASAHLKVLREARLVVARKAGKFVYYRLASADVASLWVALRETAQEHLVELRVAVDNITTTPDKLASVSREKLLEQARRGTVILIDVRPRSEFEHSHLPYARSMPLGEIEHRLAELPKSKEIVAYCRGPFCVFAEEAAILLKAKGHKVTKLLDGVAEWHAAGLSLESKVAA
jgi:rhodanese-related sulfurtransferase/DNA-binding transcriptional ArsR family regulator